MIHELDDLTVEQRAGAPFHALCWISDPDNQDVRDGETNDAREYFETSVKFAKALLTATLERDAHLATAEIAARELATAIGDVARLRAERDEALAGVTMRENTIRLLKTEAAKDVARLAELNAMLPTEAERASLASFRHAWHHPLATVTIGLDYLDRLLAANAAKEGA